MSEGTGSSDGLWWVVVTGASQGLGAAICVGLATLLPPHSRLLGLARSKAGLDSTAAAVKAANPSAMLTPVVTDLTTCTALDFEAMLEDNMKLNESCPPSRVIIFHNAGSLGSLKYQAEMKDHKHIQEHLNLNIGSVMLLNSAFLRFTAALPTTTKVTVVNISTLCAVEASRSWGLYCTSRAGRDMLFKVVAVEHPHVRVLNYAPGPLDTEMQVRVRSETQDEELRTAYEAMKTNGKLLSCETSVEKLLQVLQQDKFKSGDHVDFYDV